MRLQIDQYGSGGGHIGECGRNGAGKVSDKGREELWVYDGRWVCVVVPTFIVLPTPSSGAAHPLRFVASQIKAWVW